MRTTKLILTALSLLLTTWSLNAQENYKIYPVPQHQTVSAATASINGTVYITAESGIDQATLDRAADVLRSHGISTAATSKPVKGASNLILGVNGSKGCADKAADRLRLCREVFGKPKYDRHILSMTADKAGNAQILVLGENTDAAFCGLASLEQILDCGSTDLCCVTLYDYADVQNRGVIEGYYGVPYSAEVTKDLFRFMARYKLNTYMYGAKSDPYHSRFWSQPYPETITDDQVRLGYLSQKMLSEITEVAHASKVNFIWAIHPGDAFTAKESTGINSRIMEKFESMYALGVRQFGVFVDDVGVPYDAPSQKICADRLTELQEMVDARWNAPGTSPADMVKPLHYVPQLYAYSWNTREKAQQFFNSLSGTPSKVNIYITGRAVWTVPNNYDLDLVHEWLGRPVSWWWNYPCNDNDMSKLFPMDMYSNFKDEKHIDNLARLEDGLNTNTLILNPMQQGEISKISLFSAADYAWNNAGFDNDRSWAAAIPAVVGADRAEAFRYAAPYLRYFDADAIGYTVRQYRLSVEEGHPRPGNLIGRMKKLIDCCSALEGMQTSPVQSERLFFEDMKPWLLKLKAMAQEALDLLEGRPSSGVDFDTDPAFKFEILNGMGEDIRLEVITAEPAAEVLMPLIQSLRNAR
ncbi:MAG: beta-N-acetylglucosaminidase domain-containing protein [Bacteroidales bacterium]|nr:beta-N-acetylglucosaminidase domain-containing protein [Candidatus Cryptobacteroides onthequi]